MTRTPAAASAIGQVVAGGGALRIDIDLAGVDFCDVACLRAFILLSHASHQSPDQPGRRVILHQPPAELKNLLQILGWDSAPGLVIDESPGRLS